MTLLVTDRAYPNCCGIRTDNQLDAVRSLSRRHSFKPGDRVYCLAIHCNRRSISEQFVPPEEFVPSFQGLRAVRNKHLAGTSAATPKMLLVSICIPFDPETPPSAHNGQHPWGLGQEHRAQSPKDTHRGGEWTSARTRSLQDRRTPSPISSITCRSGDSSS